MPRAVSCPPSEHVRDTALRWWWASRHAPHVPHSFPGAADSPSHISTRSKCFTTRARSPSRQVSDLLWPDAVTDRVVAASLLAHLIDHG